MLSIFANLHGSQTARGTGGRLLGFRDLQTYMVLKHNYALYLSDEVLDPYKLTWFSNKVRSRISLTIVLDPYKLTWFSNHYPEVNKTNLVLDPYKLTWFSNVIPLIRREWCVLDPYKLTWFSN